MAIPKGIIRFTGTINGISFYETKYGWVARRKGGPKPEAMKNNASFARVRENGKEFGACGRAAGWLRKALYPFLKEASDGRMIGRLTKTLIKIKNLDIISKRGKRAIGVGLQGKEGRDLLKEFDFNIDAPIRSVLKTSYTMNANTGRLSFTNIKLKKDLKIPKGATEVGFRSLLVGIDFNKGGFELQESTLKRIALGNTTSSFVLQPSSLVKSFGARLTVLQICFYQTLNGKDYSLQNAEFNSMVILGVEVD
jgi:hypothetical protein